MPRKLRLLVRLAAIIAAFFILLQPYNMFCNTSSKCKAINLSYHIPKEKGTVPINIKFEAKSNRSDVIISAKTKTITTIANEKVVAYFSAKNISNQKAPVEFRPMMYSDPDYIMDFVEKHDCACSKEFQIKRGKEIELKMEFKITKEIEEEYRSGLPIDIKLGYMAR